MEPLKRTFFNTSPPLQTEVLQGSLARPGALLCREVDGFEPSGEANPRKTGRGKSNFDEPKVGRDGASKTHLFFNTRPSLQTEVLQGSLALPGALLCREVHGFEPSGEAHPRKTGRGKSNFDEPKVGLDVAFNRT